MGLGPPASLLVGPTRPAVPLVVMGALLSDGSPLIFIQRPISAKIIIFVILITFILPLITRLTKKAGEIPLEPET